MFLWLEIPFSVALPSGIRICLSDLSLFITSSGKHSLIVTIVRYHMSTYLYLALNIFVILYVFI